MTIGERQPVTSSLITVAQSPSGESVFKALRISDLRIIVLFSDTLMRKE